MSERDERRERAIQAVHALEHDAADPSVEEYADAVLAVLDEDRDAEVDDKSRVGHMVADAWKQQFEAEQRLRFAERDRAERAEADLAAERARVARVEALHTGRHWCFGDNREMHTYREMDCPTGRALSPDDEVCDCRGIEERPGCTHAEGGGE